VRAAVLALALAAAAWFAIGARQAHDTSRASAIIAGGGPVSRAQAKHASALLSSAGFLNPDSEVDVLRARLERAQGDLAGARAILDQVVAKEPDNAEAWFQLASSSAGSASTFVRAVRNFWRVDPLSRATR
jgi:tetratricopeptide repeat protein